MTTDITLPPMRNLGALRLSRKPMAGHAAYARLLAEAARTGSCPVWIGDPERLAPPADLQAAVAAIDRADPEAFMADRWTQNCAF